MRVSALSISLVLLAGTRRSVLTSAEERLGASVEK